MSGVLPSSKWKLETGAYQALTPKNVLPIFASVGSVDTSPYQIGGINPSVNYDSDYGSGAFNLVGVSSHGSGGFADLGSLLFLNRSRGSQASPTALQSGDPMGGIIIGGYGAGDYQLAYNGIAATAMSDWDVTQDIQLDYLVGGTSIMSTLSTTLRTRVANAFQFDGEVTAPDATATGTEHFGAGSSALGQNSTAFGSGATATTTNSVVIGRQASDDGFSGAVSLGFGAGSTGQNSFALGRSSTAAAQSIAIGYQANAGFVSSVALGRTATNTATNQFVAGATTYHINDVYFGSGVTSASPVNYALNGTGGSGTDITGGNVTIAGGKGTGTGLGGSVKIQTAQASTTGSSANSLQDRWVWDSYGQMTSNQSLTIPGVFGGFFTVWDRKDMYFTGTQTVGTGGNIGASTILFADHILKYGTSQGYSAVSIFDGRPTIRPTVGVTDNAAYVAWRTFFSAITFSPELSTAVTATTPNFGSYFSIPQIGVAAGSHASSAAVITDMYGYYSNAVVGAQSTVTTFRHLWIADATVAGTLTTQIGIEVPALTSGGTNIGIRNASSYVSTPSTAQNITAVGNTILANAETVQITSDASYTLTSAPTIADGQNGQIVTILNVDTADTITLQDQGTLGSSNLRLEATTVAIAPRQSIQLMYNTTVGDWVQIGKLITVI